MYLSRVELYSKDIPISMLKKLDESNIYAFHQWLWQLFPDQKKRNFLFRYEHIAEGFRYYLLSDVQPASHNLFRINSKSFNPQLISGDRLYFSLRANPVVTRQGKRSDVLMDAKFRYREKVPAGEIWQYQQQAAIDWLIRQGKMAGFSLESGKAIVTGYKQYSLKKSKQKEPIRFSSADLNGVLTVTEPERFIAALSHGFGKNKALGCGLMMLKRQ